MHYLGKSSHQLSADAFESDSDITRAAIPGLKNKSNLPSVPDYDTGQLTSKINLPSGKSVLDHLQIFRTVSKHCLECDCTRASSNGICYLMLSWNFRLFVCRLVRDFFQNIMNMIRAHKGSVLVLHKYIICCSGGLKIRKQESFKIPKT